LEPPAVLLPLTLHKHTRHGTYTMAFAQWISEETFKRVYRMVQHGDNRPLKAKPWLSSSLLPTIPLLMATGLVGTSC
jgi:hypothetical protein